jgi:uncharacterized protein YodC (DUF2158 family)
MSNGNPYRENSPPPPKREAKLGDVVQLKSGGGPKMTICQINGGNTVCRYFTDKGELHTLQIELCTLRIVEEV